MYLDGWERKNRYTTYDGDKASALCSQIFSRGEYNDQGHEWCVYMREKGLMTDRQWNDIPGCCATLELIQEHPMEWVRTKWCKEYVVKGLAS